jgi:hypothetical protein
MHRAVGVLNLVQAAVFVGGAVWLGARWAPAAGITGVCAFAQIVAGIALLAARRVRVARVASAATLVGVAVMVGLFLQASGHLVDRFGSDAAATGQLARGVVALALPWFLGFPLWQVLAGRAPDARTAVGAGTVLLALLLPPGIGASTSAPRAVWASVGAERVAAAEAAHALWHGRAATPPAGAGAATVLLTPWSGGEAGDAVRGDGADLAEAVTAAVRALPAPQGDDAALVLDVATAAWSDGLVPVGVGGRLRADGGQSPTVAWRPGAVKRVGLVPQWKVPQPKPVAGQPARFESAVADASGARALGAAWVAPESLTADSVRQAALEGARHIVENQQLDGKFTYVVRGPSGKAGKGYNLPRHAGTAWYLARVAERTGDPGVRAGAERALSWMVARDHPTDQGGSFVSDKRRKDGKVWVGTTSLAALAAVTLDHEIAGSWGALLGRSIDERGQVLGEMDRATGTFPAQQQNPYGQGQTLLALATLVRAGHTELEPAMVRAAGFVDGDYAPLGAVRLVGLDEHWSCLAALAVRDVTGVASGEGLCRAYLADGARPSVDGGVWPGSAAAGGRAEAVVAAAVLDPSGPYTADAMEFARLFLASAYRRGDAPFVGRLPKLVGGFRDKPWDLDVRIDGVQHIGCALLGVESLLAGDVYPGSLP